MMSETVHVVIVGHKHGTNIYASKVSAWPQVAGYARDWWGDARKYDDELPVNPPEDDSEAIRLYFEAMQDTEYYDESTVEVL